MRRVNIENGALSVKISENVGMNQLSETIKASIHTATKKMLKAMNQ